MCASVRGFLWAVKGGEVAWLRRQSTWRNNTSVKSITRHTQAITQHVSFLIARQLYRQTHLSKNKCKTTFTFLTFLLLSCFFFPFDHTSFLSSFLIPYLSAIVIFFLPIPLFSICSPLFIPSFLFLLTHSFFPPLSFVPFLVAPSPTASLPSFTSPICLNCPERNKSL